MDIIEIVSIFVKESAIAALAIFAIYELRRSYEIRNVELKDHMTQRLEERESYAERLEAINGLFVQKLGEVNVSLGANTEVLRQLLADRKK